MVDGVFRKRLNEEKRDRTGQRLVACVNLVLQPLLETDGFQFQVGAHGRQFLLQRHRLHVVDLQGAAQQARQARHHALGPVRVLGDEGPHAVEAVEEKMGIELELEGLQAGGLGLRLQLPLVYLGLPVVPEGMDAEIDRQPEKKDDQSPEEADHDLRPRPVLDVTEADGVEKSGPDQEVAEGGVNDGEDEAGPDHARDELSEGKIRPAGTMHEGAKRVGYPDAENHGRGRVDNEADVPPDLKANHESS